MTQNKPVGAQLQKARSWAPLVDELLKHGKFPVMLLKALKTKLIVAFAVLCFSSNLS